LLPVQPASWNIRDRTKPASGILIAIRWRRVRAANARSRAGKSG